MPRFSFFCKSPSFGIITHNTCKIIIALIYGESHINIIEKFSIPPPIKEEKKLNPFCLFIISTNQAVFTQGTGIVESNL